ncbi:hypothetical protein BD769DRAFT_1736116 [Suillus cothurnatus]|nr:hypothetical protein BD769DRAFT_1736116 [Suillus cothurnatus]
MVFAAGTPNTQPQDVPTTCNYTINQQTAWRMYLPPVTLHIVLYGLTICKMLTSSPFGEIGGLRRMIIDEGGHLYLLATGLSTAAPDGLDSIIITTVALIFGLIGTASHDANVFIPASYSALVNVVISVAVTRAMLTLRNLAARLHVDPGWLLSHSELSRIPHRRGLYDGELLVEINGD